VAACGSGGGDNKAASSGTTNPTTAYTLAARTTTTAVALGAIPTTASCPTSAELQTVLTQPPTETRPPRAEVFKDGSGAVVQCEYIWRSDPNATESSQVSISAYRLRTADEVKTSVAKQRQDAQDEADGKTLTAHKTGKGSVTNLDGVGDEGFVHYEKPLDYHDGPTYEFVAGFGTLSVKVRILDSSSAPKFGPESNRVTQGGDLAKLMNTKIV
jgi:hypothetical protein